MALTGTETFQVLGQDATGSPAATTQTTTTGAVAALAVGVNAFPVAKFTTGTTTTTFAVGQLTGANYVVYTNTQATPGSIATRSAAQMVGDITGAYTGQTYVLRVINGQGTGTLTITAGDSVTLTGTMTIALNTYRDFFVKVTNAAVPAITFQNIGVGTFS